jgi:hypothetical protein
VALLWKNLIAMGQSFSLRTWLVLALVAAVVLGTLRSMPVGAGLLPVLGMVAAMILVWSVVLGPQVLWQDLRHDLRWADLLKMYPAPGWQIVLGELLGPAAVLTAVQWLLIPFAVVGLANLGIGRELPVPRFIASGLVAVVVAPSMNLVSFLIPNAAVLLFPTWFLHDRLGPQGIEATGQRLILLIGQVLVMLVCLLPAAAVFAALLLVLQWALGFLVAAPLAGVAAAVVLLAEAGLALGFMGRWFERLDVSEEHLT